MMREENNDLAWSYPVLLGKKGESWRSSMKQTVFVAALDGSICQPHISMVSNTPVCVFCFLLAAAIIILAAESSLSKHELEVFYVL